MMLETVREFALEQLDASGERAALQHAHAAYALVLAEEIGSRKSPAQLAEWLYTCDDEHDNLRAALAFLVGTGDAPWALRLSVALYRYWELRSTSRKAAHGWTPCSAAGSGERPPESARAELRCRAGEQSGRLSDRVGASARGAGDRS